MHALHLKIEILFPGENRNFFSTVLLSSKNYMDFSMMDIKPVKCYNIKGLGIKDLYRVSWRGEMEVKDSR